MKDIVPIVMFASIAAIIIYNSSRRHKERIELIRRGMNPVSPPGSGGFALFLGLGGSAIGLALIVSAIFISRHFDRDMLTGGIITLFSGGAFLLYWKLTAGDRKKAYDAYERTIAANNTNKIIPAADDSGEKNAQNPD